MGRIKLKVHPLFFAFGFYFALTGRIFEFLIYTFSAVIHEIGHSIASESLGYRLNKITLMPFGAVVSGNLDKLKITDEAKIALAGPIVNLGIALLFIAFWWIYPESYAYTDVVAKANLVMAIINFIPVSPLDGGRILSSILSRTIGKSKSRIICALLGLFFSLVLFSLFIVSIFYTINFSLLFFSLFVLFGALSRDKENVYVSTFTLLSKESLSRGIPYKKQAVDSRITIKRLLGVLDGASLNEIVVFKDEKPYKTLSQAQIGDILVNSSPYDVLENVL